MNHGGGRRPRSAQERGALIATIEVFRPVVEKIVLRTFSGNLK